MTSRTRLVDAAVLFKRALRKAARTVAPTRWAEYEFRAELASNVRADSQRYAEFSGAAAHRLSTPRLAALITMDYHRLEKGMALAAPRPGFGRQAANDLIENLIEYDTRSDADRVLIELAISVLQAYAGFNETTDTPVGSLLDPLHALEASASTSKSEGGTLTKRREDLLAGALESPELFFNSRHSVRHFDDLPVSVAAIRRAVELAQRTPSVCNRQAPRAHLYESREQIERVLSHQNGNRGFGHQVDKLLVVTAKLGPFVSVSERNQAWIDGGMFASTLLWSLHSLGLGACALNCSLTAGEADALRDVSGVPQDEVFITMIAVGTVPDELRVASSQRLGSDVALHVHAGPA